MFKNLFKKQKKEEVEIRHVTFKFPGPVLDVSDATNDEMMIYKSPDQWISVEWDEDKILNILIPYTVFNAMSFPKPGILITAKPDRLEKKDASE